MKQPQQTTKIQFTFRSFFKADIEHYEGVPKIKIYLLRLLFGLMFVFVGYDTWSVIITYTNIWDPVRAAAFCMWASYSLISLIGVFYPLRLLPIVMFEIIYKLVWLIIVAYPLYTTDQLIGSPAEDMTYAFLLVVLPIVATPWKYTIDRYILGRKK